MPQFPTSRASFWVNLLTIPPWRKPAARVRFKSSRMNSNPILWHFRQMRIGGARTLPPPSQTGLADLPHPAFQLVVLMGWLRHSFPDVRRERTTRHLPVEALTQLRAAHCQHDGGGQMALHHTDAISLAALRRPLRVAHHPARGTTFLHPFAPRSLPASSLLRTL
jgi:hypothetical protein